MALCGLDPVRLALFFVCFCPLWSIGAIGLFGGMAAIISGDKLNSDILILAVGLPALVLGAVCLASSLVCTMGIYKMMQNYARNVRHECVIQEDNNGRPESELKRRSKKRKHRRARKSHGELIENDNHESHHP